MLSLLLREAKKPALADCIWSLIGPHVPADIVQDGSQYVLDGEHFFNASHGLMDLLIKTYATSIQRM